MIVDQGPEFKCEHFEDVWCKGRSILPRFGAVHRHGSIAVVERFHRTLKEMLRLIVVPEDQSHCEREMQCMVDGYNEHRPHMTLNGKTPNKVCFSRAPASEELDVLNRRTLAAHEMAQMLTEFDPVWSMLTNGEKNRIIHLLIERIDYNGASGETSIAFRPNGITTLSSASDEPKNQEGASGSPLTASSTSRAAVAGPNCTKESKRLFMLHRRRPYRVSHVSWRLRSGSTIKPGSRRG